jgi:hypothetical protein
MSSPLHGLPIAPLLLFWLPPLLMDVAALSPFLLSFPAASIAPTPF